MTDKYRCFTCGTEYPTLTATISCVESHEEPAEHVLEEAVTLDTPEIEMPLWTTPAAPELLGRAAAHMHERASTYDETDGERSMGKAVTAFNAITGHNLTESEGWLLLQVLKDVRLFTRPAYHADSAEDCIAYAALKAEAKGAGR